MTGCGKDSNLIRHENNKVCKKFHTGPYKLSYDMSLIIKLMFKLNHQTVNESWFGKMSFKARSLRAKALASSIFY